jgi:hypothetical protein
MNYLKFITELLIKNLKVFYSRFNLLIAVIRSRRFKSVQSRAAVRLNLTQMLLFDDDISLACYVIHSHDRLC